METHVVVGGVRSPVLDTGPASSTEAIVFVHGSPGDAADWQDLMSKVGGFARTVALTMPGYGGADKPADFPYTTDGYARHLGGALRELGISRVQLVAHDLGVAWGLAWAAADTSALGSLAMMDLGALPGYRWHRYARTYRRPILGEILLRLANRRAVESAIKAGSRHAIPPVFVERAAHVYADPDSRRAILRYYRATDLAADTVKAATALADAQPPTLVLWGGGDPYVPASYADEQSRFFPGARTVVLPDSGHWPFIDDPAGVEAALIPFLRAATSGAAR